MGVSGGHHAPHAASLEPPLAMRPHSTNSCHPPVEEATPGILPHKGASYTQIPQSLRSRLPLGAAGTPLYRKRGLCFLNPSRVSGLFLQSPLLPYSQTSNFSVSLIILKYVTNLPSQIERSLESTVLCQCLSKAAGPKLQMAHRSPAPALVRPLGLSSSD